MAAWQRLILSHKKTHAATVGRQRQLRRNEARNDGNVSKVISLLLGHRRQMGFPQCVLSQVSMATANPFCVEMCS